MDEHIDEVVTAQEAGLAHTLDALILAYTLEQGCILFTQDADFVAAHERGVPHSGIVYVHRNTAIGPMVHGLMLIDDVLTPSEMHDHLEHL